MVNKDTQYLENSKGGWFGGSKRLENTKAAS